MTRIGKWYWVVILAVLVVLPRTGSAILRKVRAATALPCPARRLVRPPRESPLLNYLTLGHRAASNQESVIGKAPESSPRPARSSRYPTARRGGASSSSGSQRDCR